MSEMNIRDYLEEEFKEDKLYQELIRLGREDDIFNDEVLKLYPHQIYSTKELSLILNKHESTIRNYIRRDYHDGALYDYLEPDRINLRTFRYNVRSVFKFVMMFVYLDLEDKGIADLLNILGLLSTKVIHDTVNDNRSLNNNNGTSQEISDQKLFAIGKLLEHKNHKNELLMQQLELNRKHDATRLNIEVVKNKIQIIQLQEKLLLSEKKGHSILDYSLRKTIESKNKKTGFFASFFSKKEDSEDPETILNQAQANAEKINVQINEAELQQLNLEIERLTEELKTIEEQKEVLAQKIDAASNISFNDNYDYLDQDPRDGGEDDE
ncbi:hypothetical protein [Bacillus altitudinis]|uniref:hypothetical protein n=1 Tax=Bacillus altitudinis TaxID=293387 RepID=UPI00227F0428|nr:hypothetical protein [Bacillus altitudinis]MCY7454346.1 hypothetical protein [Bacillus altitudinis]